jgi:glutamyl-tRNA reductase
MNIFITGINHLKTPVEIREKFSFSESEQDRALSEIAELPDVSECALLSTCNRTEVYIYVKDCNFKSEIIEKYICSFKGLELYDYKKHFYFFSSQKAVRHLFRVASGLESQVLGEDQILGQVKSAYDMTLQKGTSSAVLNTLFRDAITTAKKVKSFTGITGTTASVGLLAVEHAREYFGGNLKDKCALIIGAGKVGELTLKNIVAKGIGKVYITNRTLGRAASLSACEENVEVIDYNNRYQVLNRCNIVISTTRSPHYTITRDMVEKFSDKNRETVFIDLAVPRDIDDSIKELTYVRYFNMDNLKLNIDKDIDLRLLEISKAEDIIDRHVLEFDKWYEFRKSLPVVNEIQRYSDEVIKDKISSLMDKLSCVSEEERAAVRDTIDGIVKSLVDKFVYSVRECSSKEDMEVYFRCLRNVIK